MLCRLLARQSKFGTRQLICQGTACAFVLTKAEVNYDSTIYVTRSGQNYIDV